MRIMNRLREAKVKKFSKKKLETEANSELRGWPCPTRQQGQRQLCTFVCRHVHSINFEQICICYSYDNNTLARTHPHTHKETLLLQSSGGNASSFICSRKAETKLSTQRPFPVFVCCWTFDWARFATAFCHTHSQSTTHRLQLPVAGFRLQPCPTSSLGQSSILALES